MKSFLPALPLLAGFILDLIFGDPRRIPHPVRLIGRLISALEKDVREHFPEHLFFGGALLAVTVLTLTTTILLAIIFVSYNVNFWLGTAVESVLTYFVIAAKDLKKESMTVCRELEKGSVEDARKAVSMIVGRDTERLDGSGIARAAVETVAENTSDGVTAPIIFTAIFGVCGGYFYKAANTMDSMIGYKNERYLKIGKCAAKIDDALNFLPSRITAIAMIFSSFLLGYDAKNAFKIWLRDRKKHASPNSAQTESVCAGALQLRLAGDAFYFGELHHKEFIGDDIRQIEPHDICRANRLMYLTSAVVLAIFSAVRILIFGVIFN